MRMLSTRLESGLGAYFSIMAKYNFTAKDTFLSPNLDRITVVFLEKRARLQREQPDNNSRFKEMEEAFAKRMSIVCAEKLSVEHVSHNIKAAFGTCFRESEIKNLIGKSLNIKI